MSYNRAKAEELLRFYLKTAWESAGGKWDSDNDGEVKEIIDYMIKAVKEEL